MMKKKITNPSTGEEREISSSALGVWRRRGWLLKEKSSTKKHLLSVQESVVEDSAKNEEA